jgi:hypothetical protein
VLGNSFFWNYCIDGRITTKKKEDLYTKTKIYGDKTYYCIKLKYIRDIFCKINNKPFGISNDEQIDYLLRNDKDVVYVLKYFKALSNIDFYSYSDSDDTMVPTQITDKHCGYTFHAYIQEYPDSAEDIYVLKEGLDNLFNYLNNPPETCIGSLCKRFFTPRVYSTGGKRTRKQKYSARSRGINTLRNASAFRKQKKRSKGRRKIEHSTSFRNKR